jgi:hypothetical protein
MIPTFAKHSALVALLAVPVAVAVAVAAPVPRVANDGLSVADDLSLTETYCDKRVTVAETLRHDFAEEPRLVAVTGAGMTMELWTSDLLGTWTVVHHGQDGISCIVTSGQDWSTASDAVLLLDGVLETAVHQS